MKKKQGIFFLTVFLATFAVAFSPPKMAEGAYNDIVEQSNDPIQYIIINKSDTAPRATCCYWNERDPSTITVDAIRELRSRIGNSSFDSPVKLGVQMVVPYFDIKPSQSVDIIQNLIAISKKERVPVLFKLDGFTDWDNRPDLWNWWNPNQPGYNPNNKNNVEWTDWTPDAAIKISWRNWGNQFRVKPHPNLGSQVYMEAKRNELNVLLAIIADWYNNLPPQEKYLFAGVVLDNELGIGINHYYFPNGNKLLDQNPEEDPSVPWEVMNKGPSFGKQQLGYAAVKSYGIADSGQITADHLNKAVKKHAQFLASIARQYLSPEKVFVHGMWNLSEPRDKGLSYSNVVTNIVSPGWTTYGANLLNFQSDQDFIKAIKENTLKIWGAVEWSPLGDNKPNTFPAWNTALRETLSADGNKIIVIYSLKDLINKQAGDNIAAIKAVQNILGIEPNTDTTSKQEESSNPLFILDKSVSGCQVNSKNEIAPVINLAWGEYKGASDYRVYKTELGAVSQTPAQKLTNGELKFTDFDVSPGKLYFYAIEPITTNLDKKSLKTDNISVGACDKKKDTPICNPYQKIIEDQAGKQICADIPCQDRTSNICTVDSKCLLINNQSGISCQAKPANSTPFISTYGSELENTIASLCQKALNGAGIYLNDHQALCNQTASDKATGCLNSVDVNDLTGCIQRVAQQTIDELTPDAGQVVTAGITQPEQQAQRIPTQVYLQTPDGEVELPITGNSVSLPIKDNPTVVRVKIVFDKPDQSGSREIFRTFTLNKKTQQATSCDPNGDIVPPGYPNSWTYEGMDCEPTDPNNRGQKWVCGTTVKYAYGENCPLVQGSYEDTMRSSEIKSQCGLCQYSQYVNEEVKCFKGVPKDPNKKYAFNDNCIWVPECGTEPIDCP